VLFSTLIVVEQSRLGRDQIDTMVLIRDIEEAGVEIWSTRDGRRITLSDDTSKLLASLEGWRDESERKKTATRVRDAAKTRFERGYVVGGRVYGYKNERLPGVQGAARLTVNEEQAEIVRRIFRMAADGLGLSRIARQLNAEGVAGPQRLSAARVEKLRVEGKPVPTNQWSVSGVREVLHRDLYRGVVAFGKVRRTGPKTRVKLPKDKWQTRVDESLRIVDQELWDSAHARIEATRNTFLRASDGSGQMIGHAEAILNKHLLSGLLTCGAHSDAPGRTPFCGSPLVATSRGRKKVPAYVCAGYREKGKTFCSNQTGVPMVELHRAVIDSLKVTFSDQKFEEYLRNAAADTEQIAARRAEREALLLSIPKLAAAEAKLARVIAVADDVDALVAELKATQTERRQAEARVADLEGYERDLREQEAQVARLREVWGGWAAALDADVPTARQILKKILVGRIYVRPTGKGAWRFAGISRYDGALRGGLGRTGAADVQPGYGPRSEDFCRLMLHLLAEPKSLAAAIGPSRRESLAGLCIERSPSRAIAGGSDVEGWDQSGGGDSGPPCQLDGEQAGAQGQRHGFRSAAGAELRQDGRHVKLHGVARDGQARGDEPVVRPLGDQLEDLALARRQRHVCRPIRRGDHRLRQRLRMDGEETRLDSAEGAVELVGGRAERQGGAEPERARRRRPQPAGGIGQRDDGRAPRRGTNGSQRAARLGLAEHERHDGDGMLGQQPGQLPGRADLDAPAGDTTQRGFDTGRVHRVPRDDDDRPRTRVAVHALLASAAETKRRTSLIGIASARRPVIIVLMPTM
jgi:DNA invertase Pin-like site-specific DNA recombinase